MQKVLDEGRSLLVEMGAVLSKLVQGLTTWRFVPELVAKIEKAPSGLPKDYAGFWMVKLKFFLRSIPVTPFKKSAGF